MAALCRDNGLLLMIDGARIGAAVAAVDNNLTLADLAECADVFWIGGTKAGALFGEALVVANAGYRDDIAFHLKQRGALLAKGRALGIQFRELFRDGLFFELAAHANQMAGRIAQAVVASGYSLAAPTESNQVFPVLPDNVIAHLRREFDFYNWAQAKDNHSVVRLVTSWAGTDEHVDAFIAGLQAN